MLFVKAFSFVSRFFFYKVIVKTYKAYRYIKKILGIPDLGDSLAVFMINKKFVHVLVVLLTILLTAVNLAPKTQAGTLADRAHQTVLADLIASDFSLFDETEELIIESFDKATVAAASRQSYLGGMGIIAPQPKASLSDVEEFEGSLIIHDDENLIKPDISATTITKRQRKEKVLYKIQSGDSISTIARKFEVSVNTILWENNLSSHSIIRPGKELIILPVSGLTHTVKSGDTVGAITRKYDVEEDIILETNKLANASMLKIGQELLIPGGSKVTVAPTVAKKTYTGFSAIKNIVSSSKQEVAGNKMLWPTPGRIITQYYSWRHKGLDIGDKTGTPLYAVDAGTVEKARWGNGYGYYVLINHGGGKKTRYAHASKFYVKEGDKVDKGQTIAAMGSTGWSTGPHIHFEVIIDGVKYNPLSYIK